MQHRGDIRPPRAPLGPRASGPGDRTRRDKEDRAGGPVRPDPPYPVASRPPGRRPGVQGGPGGPEAPPVLLNKFPQPYLKNHLSQPTRLGNNSAPFQRSSMKLGAIERSRRSGPGNRNPRPPPRPNWGVKQRLEYALGLFGVRVFEYAFGPLRRP